MTSVSKPNKWIAAIVALLLSPPVGLLYAAKLGWAIAYFIALVVVAIASIWSGAESLTLFYPLLILIGVIHAFLAAGGYPAGLPRPWYSKWYGLLGIVLSFVTLIFLARAFLYEPFRMASSAMLPNIEKGKHVIISKWGYGNNGTFGITLRKGAITTPIRHGDVMVFIYPGSDERLNYLMRVVGLPGDLVEYKNKSLAINGRAAAYRDLGAYHYVMPTGAISTRLKSESIGTTEHRVLHTPDLPAVFPDSVNDFTGKAQCSYRPDGFACRVPDKHYFMLGDNRDASNDSRYWGFVPEDHMLGKVINFKP